MTFVLNSYVLENSGAGFVYSPIDTEANQFLIIFAVLAAGSLGMQFFVPRLLAAKLTTPQGALSVSIIRMALCESIAVFGFLNFLMSGLKVESWVFMAVAFIALMLGDRKAEKAL